MIRVWIGLLPSALGIAISVMPLLFLILMLTSRRGLTNAISFEIGWFLAIVVMVGILVSVFDRLDFSSQSAPTTAAVAIELVVGGGLLLIGLYRLLKRKQAEDPKPPRWMNLIDKVNPWLAFAVGVGSIVFNAKNLAFLLVGVSSILRAQLGPLQWIITTCVYALIASSTMLAPLVILVTDRDHGDERLERLRLWLIRHNSRVMGGLFVFLGLPLFVDALQAVLF